MVYPRCPSNFFVPDNPQTPRKWGLKHESSARQSYLKVERKRHHKLTLVSKGLLLSKSKPFLGNVECVHVQQIAQMLLLSISAQRSIVIFDLMRLFLPLKLVEKRLEISFF